LNTEIVAKILHITKKKPIKISLGTLDCYFKDSDDREDVRNRGKDMENHVTELWDSI
jgi:hypothetical protein